MNNNRFISHFNDIMSQASSPYFLPLYTKDTLLPTSAKSVGISCYANMDILSPAGLGHAVCVLLRVVSF